MNAVLSSRPLSRRAARVSVAAAALLVALPAPAALIVTVGDLSLQPDQAGQQVSLSVQNTGDDPLDYGGLNFSIRIADGAAGPALTGVDLLTGTPLEGTSFGGQFPGGGNTPRQQFWSVISLTAELPPGESRLATLTFDTTGLGQGEWALSLFGPGMPTTQMFNHVGDEYAVTLQNGTLTVVPEAGAVGLLAASGLLGFGLWRRATR